MNNNEKKAFRPTLEQVGQIADDIQKREVVNSGKQGSPHNKTFFKALKKGSKMMANADGFTQMFNVNK